MKCSVQTQTSSQIYFNTGLLLSNHAKDEQWASRQVMALHCLPLRPQNEMCCILVCFSAKTWRGTKTLTLLWTTVNILWLCVALNCHNFNPTTSMDSCIVWWSLCRMLYLLWKKIFLDIILYITFNVFFFFFMSRQGYNCSEPIRPNGQVCHCGCVSGPSCQQKQLT